jgi:hypothetical protein
MSVRKIGQLPLTGDYTRNLLMRLHANICRAPPFLWARDRGSRPRRLSRFNPQTRLNDRFALGSVERHSPHPFLFPSLCVGTAAFAIPLPEFALLCHLGDRSIQDDHALEKH